MWNPLVACLITVGFGELRRVGKGRARSQEPPSEAVRQNGSAGLSPRAMRILLGCGAGRNRRNIQVARRRYALHHRGTAHGAFRDSHDRTRVVVPRGLLLRHIS